MMKIELRSLKTMTGRRMAGARSSSGLEPIGKGPEDPAPKSGPASPAEFGRGSLPRIGFASRMPDTSGFFVVVADFRPAPASGLRHVPQGDVNRRAKLLCRRDALQPNFALDVRFRLRIPHNRDWPQQQRLTF